MTSLLEVTNKYPILNRAIIGGYRGSIAHGMYVPPKEPTGIDDKDLMYIVVPELDYYFGHPSGWKSNEVFPVNGTREIKQNEWDIVVYEVTKFIGLLAQGNPNVLSMLWLDDNFFLTKTEPGRLLIENRNLFVGKHVYHSFTGYAHSQLHKMTHNAFQGHMGDKRRALVEKFGYDTKNASHLVRLLRMGIEFLVEGRLHVKREDASELLEIKKGEWTLEQVQHTADALFEAAQRAYTVSNLPAHCDHEKINKLSVEVVRSALIEFGK